MNKKLLILGLAAGLTLGSCQKEDVSESLQTETLSAGSKTLEAKQTETFTSTSRIHEPVFRSGDLGAYIHEPVFLGAEGFFECGDLYEGGQNLIVNKYDGETLSYSSGEEALELKKLVVGDDLNLCGDFAVENTVNIRWAGVLQLFGEMTIGSDEKPTDLVINHGGHLNLMGHVHVSGDLIVNDGATIEFMGEDPDANMISVGGNIEISENAIIKDHSADHVE